MDALPASGADVFRGFDGVVGVVVGGIDLVACFAFLVELVGAGAGAGHGEEFGADIDEAT